MNAPLKICVADDEVDMRDYFRKILPRLGHEVLSIAHDGRQLVDHCLSLQPDLAITDVQMPRLDGITAAEAIYRNRPLPIILVSAHNNDELISQAASRYVLAFLVKPVRQAELQAAIKSTSQSFREFRLLCEQSPTPDQALLKRHTLNRAKKHLMQSGGIDASAAFQRLQELSAIGNEGLVDAAQRVLKQP